MPTSTESPPVAKLATNQLASLERLCQGPRLEPIGAVEHFVLQYIFLESSLRILLSAYRERDGLVKPANEAKGHKSIKIDVVQRALNFYGCEVDLTTLNILFDSSKRSRGETNARALRNALVHHWDIKAFSEVQTRGTKLISAMVTVTREIERSVSINQI